MVSRILPAKKDLLVPCPGCGEVKSADAGHHICRQCEGYPNADLFGSYPAADTIGDAGARDVSGDESGNDIEEDQTS